MSGAVVIITGATDGIGLELARQIQSDQLLLIGRRDFARTPLVGWHPQQHYCRVDLSQPDAELAVASWLNELGIGAIDLLVHNAAIGYWGKLEEQGSEAIQRMLNLNLRTPIALTHHLLPLLLGNKSDHNGGDAPHDTHNNYDNRPIIRQPQRRTHRSRRRPRVLFVGSVAARIPLPGSALYAATKAGLDQFGRNLALELAGQVDVAVVHPGATATQIFSKSGYDLERLRSVRMMSPQRVARAIGRARHSSVVGFTNRLGFHLGRVAPRLLQRMIIAAGNKSEARAGSAATSTGTPNGVSITRTGLKPGPQLALKPTPTPAPKRDAVCLLTGATGGIGAALAERYAASGMHLILTDVGLARLAQLRQRLLQRALQAPRPQLTGAAAGAPYTPRIDLVDADLSRPEAVANIVAAARRTSGLDYVVLNAGTSAVGRFDTLPPTHIDRVLHVNLYAPSLLCAALLHEKLLRRDAKIIFLSSLGVYTGYPGAAVYAATKAALAALAGNLEVDLHAQLLHTLTVFPGPVRTAHARRYSPIDSEARAKRRMPPERLAQEIVAAGGSASRLIPGPANRLFALLGLLAPRVTESIMRRAILEHIHEPLL